MKNKKIKEKKKFKLWELIFVGISSLMVFTCVILYGSRFIHYYMIEHPKDVDNRLSSYIKRNARVFSGDGLYTFDEHEYYYKGLEVNNYLWYSGRLFRIIEINDNGIKLITADSEGSIVFSYDKEYSESYVNSWLNEYYLGTLDKESLVEYDYCVDDFNLENVTCNKDNKGYIGLLSISDYLRSGGKDSYLNNHEYYWTSNSYEGKEYYIYSTGGINNIVNKEDSYYSYGVRPVIVLNDKYEYYGGDGSIDTPYQVNEGNKELLKELNVGEYIKFSNYLWRVQSINTDNVKLIMNEKIDSVSKNYSDTIKYLNNDFYKKLDNKKIKKCEFNTGSYGKDTMYDYKNVSSKKTNAYVGVPSVTEINLNSYKDIWLYNTYPSGKNLYYKINNDGMILGDININKNGIVPVICIDSNLKITSGNGTINGAYEVGE